MINIVVEGDSDRELAKAVVRAAGRTPNRVRAKGGKSRLDPDIAKYNAASHSEPWVVFRDSDRECPVTLHARLTAAISDWQPRFSLRIAHTMAEAWLLADREGFSHYFSVPLNRVPFNPESLPHAKHILLALCAGSRSKAVRQDMTAEGGAPGPLFVSRVNDFASTTWNAVDASSASESLRRAIAQIAQL